MPVTLSTEQDEQRRWKLRPNQAKLTVYDQLVANEFLTADERRRRQEKALSAILRFSARQVPHYRKLFAGLNLKRVAVPGPSDLLRIPALAKSTIQESEATLVAERLPRGGKIGGSTQTSGTTGASMRILHSMRSHEMYHFLTQRSRRWDRFDPAGSFAAIRQRPNLPYRPDGTPLPDGETIQFPAWSGIGHYFHTGPFLGFAKSNPTQRIADWIEQYQADYVQTDSSLLEHLALEFQSRPPLRCVRTFKAVSEPLTAGRRARIEKMFEAPVSPGYGLNEIGIIAACCPETGRYHVHDEHCLIEIVDDENRPVATGEFGRILVTTLTNFAMPLIRYDTGDIAEALDGPCPCGRTLPSFGEVPGRRSRIDPLPPEVVTLADTILEAMEQLPVELSYNLRMYQLFHFRDGSFELRTVVADSLPPAFAEHISRIWRDAAGARPNALRIARVENIRPAPSEKIFHFDSELLSPPGVQGDQA